MKTQKVRLSLKKQTISNISADKMNRVKGGVSEAGITLPPCTGDCGGGTAGCVSWDCQSKPNMYITCLCPYTESPDCW